MKFLLTSTVVAALALALTAPFALAADKTDQPSQSAAAAAKQKDSGIAVVPADQLVGKTVLEKNGAIAGEIEYVVIDMSSGKLENIVLGSGGVLDIGEELIAVPWQAVSYRGENAVELSTTLEKLRQAERLPKDRLFELTEPEAMSRITEYYALPKTEMDEADANADRPIPHILIGREVITTIAAPTLTTVEDMRGTEVESRAGQEIAEIAQVVLDTDRGHIAYLILERGGVLGVGEERVPVPYEALAWSPLEQHYKLQARDLLLKPIGELQAQNLPAELQTSQIETLYDHYQIDPYWRHG